MPGQADSPLPPASDVVSLRIPARPGYTRLARVGAASIALRLGAPLRVIDDLRLALDEAMILLLDSTVPDDEILVEYRVSDGELSATLGTRRGHEVSDGARDRFAAMVDGLIDAYEVDTEIGAVSVRKSLGLKR